MNRSSSFLFLLLIALVKGASGQDFIVEGAAPRMHLTHKVEPKETWFSLGRAYNVSAKELATYNKMGTDKPLEIGQALQVPLTKSNFTQNDVKSAGDVLLPVYHVVQEKEWMYRISVNYNKVPIEKLEKWNAINRDQAKAGMKLIIGYLKVKEGGAMATTQKGQETTTAAAPVTNTPEPSKPATQPKQETTGTDNGSSAGVGDGGFFRGQYDNNNAKNSSGVAGIFKSTSGWSDGKYYALMNNVTVGTIVKVSFPQTNKSVYAKVLGELPEMKESAGLALRISDAAAKELGAVANKFSVDVMY